jgi:hypothetical protein
MSTEEPSSHNPEHISAETKASSGDSKEQQVPPFSTQASQEQGIHQQKPSHEYAAEC